MRLIKVNEVYKVTQISKANKDAWKILGNIVEEANENILFDFEEIYLDEPYNNMDFRNFMLDERVHIKIYGDDKLKNTIDLMCKLGGMKSGRVINGDMEEIEIEVDTSSNEEKRLRELTDRIREEVVINEGKAFININNILEQLSEVRSIKAIELLIEEIIDREGLSEFIIDSRKIFIAQRVLDYISRVIESYKNRGIELKLESDNNRDLESKLELYRIYRETLNITKKNRVDILNETLNTNAVVIVSRYKATKALDEFGRCGEGEPLVTRVALYKGIEGDKIKLLTFNGDYFYTRQDYYLDNEVELDELEVEEWSINIEDTGLCNSYLGRLYHINLPIQYNIEDYRTYYYAYKDEGENIWKYSVKKATLPGYIKMVLDDYGIKHDSNQLMEVIQLTNKHLKGQIKGD